MDKIAAYLDNSKYIGTNREYNSWQGEILNTKVLVVSTGIGGPSAAICMEELINIGVDTFIRVGTCGGMQPNVKAGDLIIPSGVVRMDGTTKEYVPIEFPAVPDFELTSNLVETCKKENVNYHVGVTQSKDSFYGQHNPNSMPVGYELEQKWKAWIKSGSLASDMECSTVFTLGSVRKVRTAAVMGCIWNQESQDGTKNIDTNLAIKIAIDSLKLTIEKDKKQNK